VVKLGLWLIVIVLVPTALALGVARLLGIRQSMWIFLIAAFSLPAIAFSGGSALLIYFLAYVKSLPPGTQHSGEGPAFFGILAIMFVLPVLLMAPGFLSGFLASHLFHRAMPGEED
jgi:hypothetical protein